MVYTSILGNREEEVSTWTRIWEYGSSYSKYDIYCQYGNFSDDTLYE